MRLPSRKVIKDKLTRHILYKPELFIYAYADRNLVQVKKKKSLDREVLDFIKGLQWDLRSSYNSSSCLNEKQRSFLEERLYDLVIKYKGGINDKT